jgi:hypothetical protein
MKNEFVADGPFRFLRGKKLATPGSITKKFATALATATPAEKKQIQARIAAEILRREKTAGHQPSPATLW